MPSHLLSVASLGPDARPVLHAAPCRRMRAVLACVLAGLHGSSCLKTRHAVRHALLFDHWGAASAAEPELRCGGAGTER